MEDIIKKLKNFGFTLSESKVYIFLLQYQEAKASIISSKTNIPSSHIYDILEKLLEKGIISFKITNNIKIYRPVEPESLFSFFREKEKKIEEEKKDLSEFVSKLKTLEFKESKENDFKYFEGINGVKSMFNEFVKDFEPNSEVLIASAPIAYNKWNAFLMEYFQIPRIKKGVKQRLIIPESMKIHGKEREKLKLIEVRYTKTELETEFGVAGDKVYFLSQGEQPYALLIKDKNLAKTQKKIFDILWKKSK
jgi:sugar-specific transcriptional regulator TrmB